MTARKRTLIVAATAFATFAAMILVLNLSLGNKQVDADSFACTALPIRSFRGR